MSRSPYKRPAVRTTDAALDELLELEGGSLDALAAAMQPSGGMARVGNEADVARGRDRLLAALESMHRFDDLEASVAELLDVDRAEAARMLLDVDRADVWRSGPNPTCSLFHVDGGPSVRDAVTGFVRIAPGAGFPQHEHLGDETVLVLQGAFRDVDGTIVSAGEIARMPGGSVHSLEVYGDLPLLYLAIVQRGVVIDGTPLYPDDPRA